MAYTEESHTQQPAVVLREKGATAWSIFPGDYERSGWRSGNADISQLLQKYIRWTLQIGASGRHRAKAWSNCRVETIPAFAVHILTTKSQSSSRLESGGTSDRAGNRQNELPHDRKIARVNSCAPGTGIPFVQNGPTMNSPCRARHDYEVAALTAVSERFHMNTWKPGIAADRGILRDSLGPALLIWTTRKPAIIAAAIAGTHLERALAGALSGLRPRVDSHGFYVLYK